MTTLEVFALAASAAAAGAINAIAGGGTLITFPVLLLFHTPANVANATSTLALVLGTSGSIFGYRKQLVEVRSWLSRFLPVSLVGGLLGSILLTSTKNETFERMVPYLLLFATILFLSQNVFRSFAASDQSGKPKHHAIFAAILFQFLVAIYGGYFGAGIGILMLASLGFIGFTDIHQMNSLKTVLGSLINLVAAVWFTYSGLVYWPKALVMTVGAIIGYYLGSHFAQSIPQKRVRQIITGIGLLISAVMFYRQFRG